MKNDDGKKKTTQHTRAFVGDLCVVIRGDDNGHGTTGERMAFTMSCHVSDFKIMLYKFWRIIYVGACSEGKVFAGISRYYIKRLTSLILLKTNTCHLVDKCGPPCCAQPADRVHNLWAIV